MSSWTATEIVQMQIADIIPYDRNPRTHPESQINELANSIRQWGFTAPILVDEEGTVIAGHGRLYAAHMIGLETVPAIVAEGWSDNQKKAYVIADNKLSENSSWDEGMFFSELKELSRSGFDLSLIGMDQGFSFDEFKPNLDPQMTHGFIDDNDINKADQGITDHISSLNNDKADNAIEVMCPYCAETFKYSGT